MAPTAQIIYFISLNFYCVLPLQLRFFKPLLTNRGPQPGYHSAQCICVGAAYRIPLSGQECTACL